MFKYIIFNFIIFAKCLLALNGFTTYNTKNNPKAKNLNLNISIPNNYIQKTTYRPNVALKFIDKRNKGNMIMVLVYKQNKDMLYPTENNVLDYCNFLINDMNTHNMPSKLYKCNLTSLETLPTINMIYNSMGERAGYKFNFYTNSYFVFYKDYSIYIQGSSSTVKNFLKEQNNFIQVVNSLVINNLYGN